MRALVRRLLQGHVETVGGQGSPAAPAVCAGGLSFVGPTIGQIASVIGPTIISPAVVGTSLIVASGSNIVAPGAG
jgi:hypothetical protein